MEEVFSNLILFWHNLSEKSFSYFSYQIFFIFFKLSQKTWRKVLRDYFKGEILPNGQKCYLEECDLADLHKASNWQELFLWWLELFAKNGKKRPKDRFGAYLKPKNWKEFDLAYIWFGQLSKMQYLAGRHMHGLYPKPANLPNFVTTKTSSFKGVVLNQMSTLTWKRQAFKDQLTNLIFIF